MNGRATHDLPPAEPLTPREQEILSYLTEGLSNRQIAEQLVIALSTVKWHVRQIYNKLGVGSRGDAVATAKRLGLLPADDDRYRIRHNLPAETTPFVGREQELAALAKFISDPQVRIITIVGPGGMGKTRLALRAAGQELKQSHNFADGIFFISLAPLNSAAELVPTLAAALEFHFQDASQGSKSELQQILDYLRHKQMLLVMDNFEHLLDGLTILIEILGWAPQVTFLVTSRERLQLRSEQLFPLQGLEVPSSDDLKKKSIAEYASSQLFLNISKLNSPDFKLMPGEDDHLLRICRLVEGMPLGLELAASWVGVLPMSVIVEDIEQSLDRLTSQHHDVPQRHRSMQATLDVSWKRLSSEQILALKGLTVFRGGITRPAALEIASASLPLLVTLMNKSLLTYDRESDRYTIHELLRQYGAQKLNDDRARQQEIQNKHCAYFCGYLKEREEDLSGSARQETISELRHEIDNIQIAWRWAAEQRDAVLLAQGLNSLCSFYLWEVRMTDGLIACQTARKAVSKLMAEQLVEDPQNLILLSQILAWESDFVDEIAQKEKLLTQSQGILDRVPEVLRDTRSDQANIFLRQANTLRYRDYEEAIRLANLGLIQFQELGDRIGEAEAQFTIGNEHLYLGDYDRANELLLDSLKIKRQLGDMEGITRIKFALGTVARHQGRFDEAEALHRQSLELYRQQGNRRSEAMCLRVLSYTYSFAGKFLAAKEAAERAIDLDRDLGQFPIAESANACIMAIIHLGHYGQAKSMAAENLEAARQRGLLMDTSWGLSYLGMVALARGDFDGAKQSLQEGVDILMELKHIYHSILRAILSYVVRAQGDGELACSYLADALRSAIEYRSISPIIYCLPAAALLIADNGHTERAIELYGLAQRFDNIANSHWFADIACRELDGMLHSALPEIAAAADRGRGLDLLSTAEEIQRELENL